MWKVIILNPDTPERTWQRVSGPTADKPQVLGSPEMEAWYISVPDDASDEKIGEYIKLLERTPDWGDSKELDEFSWNS